jgi:hypothetical protein
MQRLNRAIARDRAAAVVSIDRPAPRARQFYAGYLAMAALVVLVTISIVFVLRSRSAPTAPPAAIAEQTPATASGDDAAFAALSEEHFERSKLVVLGLATRDPEHTRAADWQYERQLAGTLLADTRLYRLAAQERGVSDVARVMRDLETVLLEASMSDGADRDSLEHVQRLIARRGLVSNMQMVASSAAAGL